MRRTALALAALVLLATAAEEEEAPAAGQKHAIQLRGGTLLVGDLEPAELLVATAFGELTVPVTDLRRVRFGRKSDPERYQGVLTLIEDLGSASRERRLQASASLKQMGLFAAPELKASAESHTDPEVRRICQELFEALEVSEEEFLPEEDVIETSGFTMRGSVVQKAFKVTVAELGAVDVRRKDVIEIRVQQPKRTKKLAIDGQHTLAQGWLDTGIEIKKDQTLRVFAEGSIQFPNWGGQSFTPDGNLSMGNLNGIAVGTLVGRIGNGGQVFAIGRSYIGMPEGKGTLQLCVMVNAGRQPSTGEFTVRLELE